MDFRLTKEEALFQKMCREFALNEVEPIAAEIDAEERYPEETVQKLMKYGLMGIQFPKEVGGSGGNYICYSIAIEEMSRVCGTTGGIMSAHGTLGAWPIYAFGTPEQKEKWLRPLIEPKEGAKIGAFGLTEPNAGTDSAAQQTMAVKQEDGSYIMNGSKVFITGGGRADTYVVFAMTDKTKGNKGISAFIVDKDDPGFSIGKIEHKMGIRGSQTAELIFEDAEGEIEQEVLEEDLPYDMKADVIKIDPKDFGIWYIDALDKKDRYEGKVVEFTGMVLKSPEFPKNYFVPGRMAMTCCEADMTFLGFICKAREARNLETKQWVKVRAKIAYEFWQDYDGVGPVLYAESVEPAEEIKEIVQF